MLDRVNSASDFHRGSESGMDLGIYLEILWRRRWVIAVTALMTLAVTVAGTFLATPIYSATTKVRVATPTSGSVDWIDYDVQYVDRLLNTYVEIAASGPVLAQLKQQLGIDAAPQVQAEVIPNTELIQITVEDPDRLLATAAANAVADIIIERSRQQDADDESTVVGALSKRLAQLEEELAQDREEHESLATLNPPDPQRTAALSRSIELNEGIYAAVLLQYEQALVTRAAQTPALSVVEPALIPRVPSKPRKLLNIILGCAVGVIGGVGLSFLFEHLDTRLHTVEQIEETTALPVLGRIPDAGKGPPSIFLNGGSPQGEAYRHLRTRICAAAQERATKTLLVTSAEPLEGKSTIVTNLAAAMAQAGRRVLAVDGDLRRPTLHINFELPNGVGLSSVLTGELGLQEAMQDTEMSGVSVLTSGPLPPNPAELLGSSRMKALLEEIPRCFDIALIDTPALLPVTDAAVVAPGVDGVLLVVSCAQVESKAVQSACRELTEIGTSVVGLVVNWATESPGYRYYGYFQTPDAAPQSEDLTRTRRIGPIYKALRALGIVGPSQPAEQDSETLEESLGVQTTAKRIRLHRWGKLAKRLSRTDDAAES